MRRLRLHGTVEMTTTTLQLPVATKYRHHPVLLPRPSSKKRAAERIASLPRFSSCRKNVGGMYSQQKATTRHMTRALASETALSCPLFPVCPPWPCSYAVPVRMPVEPRQPPVSSSLSVPTHRYATQDMLLPFPLSTARRISDRHSSVVPTQSLYFLMFFLSAAGGNIPKSRSAG